jgi:hypothetical protein
MIVEQYIFLLSIIKIYRVIYDTNIQQAGLSWPEGQDYMYTRNYDYLQVHEISLQRCTLLCKEN